MANQISVSSASPERLISASVKIPDSIIIASPRKAIAVASRPSGAASAQPIIMVAKVARVIHSFADIAPRAASCAAAAAGASGVCFNSGGNHLYRHQGTKTMAHRVGRLEASSQLAKVISTPCRAISATPMGLAAMAVSQRADDNPSPAMLHIIR